MILHSFKENISRVHDHLALFMIKNARSPSPRIPRKVECSKNNFRNCSDIWSPFEIVAVICGDLCNLILAYFIIQGDFLLDLHKCIIRSLCDLHKFFSKSSQDLQLSLKIGKLID